MDDFHGTPPEIQIKAEDDIAKGRFANLAQVGSTIDSFALDFAFVQGRTGWLLARLLISPGHAKRFHQVLGDTIARYEERFGPIDLGPAIQ
jgi:hypothetical protein